jgi:hypothetical protein
MYLAEWRRDAVSRLKTNIADSLNIIVQIERRPVSARSLKWRKFEHMTRRPTLMTSILVKLVQNLALVL